MLHAFGFVVRFRPREADDISEQHLRELMPQRKAFRKLPAFARKVDAAQTIDAHVAITRHALQGRGDRRRRYIQFFGKASADGRLVFLEHLPDGLEVIFLRHTGFITPQTIILAPLPLRTDAPRSVVLAVLMRCEFFSEPAS